MADDDPLEVPFKNPFNGGTKGSTIEDQRPIEASKPAAGIGADDETSKGSRKPSIAPADVEEQVRNDD
jgi:hypothetical protein